MDDTRAARSQEERFFWQPSRKANCVQIGSVVTARREGESVAALLDRAIREFPDKRATLVVVGWRD